MNEPVYEQAMLHRSIPGARSMPPGLESSQHGYGLGESLRSVLDLLRRRWLTLLLVAAGVFVIAVAVILQLPAKYQAVARVQLDPSRNPLAGPDNQIQSLASEAIETQVTLLGSDEVAREVVKRLGLLNDPEFAPDSDGGAANEADRINAVVRKLRGGVSIRRDKLTYVINIGFKASDPDRAARIANGIAQTYIDTQVGSRVGTAARQSAFFQRQLSDLEAQVRAADDAVARYRAGQGIAGGTGNSTIVDQQVAPVSTQLATAESEAAEARASLATARQQVARGGIDAVSAVRESPVVADLRRQRAEVVRAMAEVDARYGPKHAESLKVHEQLAGIDAQINDEARRVVASLEAQAAASSARAASLRSTLGGLQGQQARNLRASVVADSLQREADSKRATYERLVQLSLQSSQGVRNQIAQASIIDPAVPPTAPAEPNRKLLLAMAMLVAAAIGLATIILQDMLASGIRSQASFEERFGVPVIAAVPRVRKIAAPADLVASKPGSLFVESLRMARASLFGRRAEREVRVVALTSALPEEGKTTTALALARVLAGGGKRTVLVDCDLRRATMSRSIGAAPEVGLEAVLLGQAPIEQAIVADGSAPLDLLVIKQAGFDADGLFAGDRFAELIAQLRGRYECVVLDLSPVVGLADARAVASAADAVLLVVKWGATPARAVDAAVRLLRGDGIELAGAVFTMVDPKAEAIGGSYYSRKYQAYYQPT
jgi:polysaccharide biosynthesis transport protein